MNPILQYLLEFNKTDSIEYSDRYLIPPGGLAKMLTDFNEFHLNTVVVVKDELHPPPEARVPEASVDELYKLLDD